MQRIHGTVTYQDGRTEDFSGGTALLAEWELYALRAGLPVEQAKAPRVLQAAFLAYTALHRGRTDAPAFDAWRAGVDDLEVDVTGVDPTPPAASAG